MILVQLNKEKLASPSVRAQLQTTETTLASLRKERFTRYSVVYKITEGAEREAPGLRVPAKLAETASYPQNHSVTSEIRKTAPAAAAKIWKPVTAELC